VNVFTIVSEALQSLPPKVRKGLYSVYALVVIGAGVAQILDYDTANLNDILLYVGGFLGVTAATNVATSTDDTVKQFWKLAEDEKPDIDPDTGRPFDWGHKSGEHKG
jgi:hypothetical protein